MPATITTPLDLDVDLYGPLLVAEIEAYLKTVIPTGGPTPLRTAPTVHIPAHGSTTPPWWAGHPQPARTLTDRILRRPAPTIQVTAREHLQLMDRYITQHGWTQGGLWDATGAVCVLGAHLQVLAHGYGTPATAWQARLLIGNALGRAGHPIPVDTWNDEPGRTKADIHNLLRTAATT
ncbi:hypothetical protein ACGFZP_13150 [Kitasatospora sp. NPDC048239]|uniref:DUF6197 family protein n=1 Tax=Kitasatospora sp. NPDC048239 TaxID=3364046 RepID=UPI0037165208